MEINKIKSHLKENFPQFLRIKESVKFYLKKVSEDVRRVQEVIKLNSDHY